MRKSDLTGTATATTADTDPINGTGNALANILTGNAGDNVLDGGAGNDTFIGNAGNDTFLVDNAAELDAAHIQENANEGSDTIKTAVALGTLGVGGVAFTGIANVENYVNTGSVAWNVDLHITQPDVAHILTGGGGNDILVGGDKNDTIDGGKGNDAMTGGKGDDTYVVDSLGDSVTEASGAGTGTDTVKTSVLIADTTNFANVENFTYTGTAAWTFTGNDGDNVITGSSGADKLSGGKGNDTLIGNDGDDTLDGGAGNDQMFGGKGNDTYIVDSANDTFDETGGSGIDTVKSLVNIDLTGDATIENLTALSGGSVNALTGNALNNTIDASALQTDVSLTGGAGQRRAYRWRRQRPVGRWCRHRCDDGRQGRRHLCREQHR